MASTMEWREWPTQLWGGGMDALSSRELASIIWILVGLTWVLSRADLRPALVRAFLAVRQWAILLPMGLFGAYMTVVVFCASRVGLWDARLLPQLVVWSVVSGLVMMFQSVDRRGSRSLLRSALMRIASLGVLVEFYMNAVSFHVVVELLIQPLVAVLVGVQMASGADPEHAATQKLVTGFLTAIGLGLLTATTLTMYARRSELDFSLLSESLILTLVLPILVLPFMYALSLYAGYELAFIRMHILGRRTPSVAARAALLVGLNGRLRDVWGFAGHWPGLVARESGFRAALAKVAEFRALSRSGQPHEVQVSTEH